MPNYCVSTLTIDASDELLNQILNTLQGTDDEEKDNPFDFNKVIPMPEYIFRGPIGREEEALYGKNNWYDWSIENWGTKWNSCDTVLQGNTFSFWTAWSPCSPVIEKLAEIFPDASFDYWYEEPGMGFCGREIYENGKLKYYLDAEIIQYYFNDEDEEASRINNYLEGRKDEDIIYDHKDDKCWHGRYHKRTDADNYVTIIDGTFIELLEPTTQG